MNTQPEPLSNEQLLQLEPQDAIKILMQSEGISEAEAWELYDAMVAEQEEQEPGPAAP